jgi:hypothetical protein
MYPIIGQAIDPLGVEILADPAFQSSCREVRGLTLLDVPRLANLWQLCRITNRQGGIIEVGAYRGGAALHLSNSCPTRAIVVCDSFAGFEALDPLVDRNFKLSMFRDARKESVEGLFEGKQRDVMVVGGFFPQSCVGLDLGPTSFAHVDVDTYIGTSEALNFLNGSITEKSLIVLDDYMRKAEGVDRAITEFVRGSRTWVVVPMFPSQAVPIHVTWFD